MEEEGIKSGGEKLSAVPMGRIYNPSELSYGPEYLGLYIPPLSAVVHGLPRKERACPWVSSSPQLGTHGADSWRQQVRP